jgi:hypothetical protein
MVLLRHHSHGPCRFASLALGFALAACSAPTTSRPPLLGQSGQQCLAALDRLGVQYQVAPLTASAEPACRVENPVRVAAATVPWNQPAIASCGFVLAFDRFEREAVRPLAMRYFGKDIRTIIHRGAYSCRPTRSGRESEHAHGTAFDLAGFELVDGTQILVKQDWTRHGKARDFLLTVTAQACAYFNEVLSPDSDHDHLDHIHLDLGPYKLCVRRRSSSTSPSSSSSAKSEVQAGAASRKNTGGTGSS